VQTNQRVQQLCDQKDLLIVQMRSEVAQAKDEVAKMQSINNDLDIGMRSAENSLKIAREEFTNLKSDKTSKEDKLEQ